MYFRSVKCTCKNTVMKESVRNFYLDNFDLMDPASALMISYKVDLSDNQFLHVGLFASENVADTFAGKLARSTNRCRKWAQRSKSPRATSRISRWPAGLPSIS